jgi:ribosomal protein S18 acetylase RimI-like enzyme
MTDALQIRPMTRAEMDRALDWAAEEGWNPGLDDAGCFRQADEGGFIAGFIDGQMVASISVVAYDHAFAFLGFYIVAPAFRGRGFGFALW